jgi:hypothetical protein
VLNTPADKREEAAKQMEAEVSLGIDLCRALFGNSDWGKVRNILTGLNGQDVESVRRQVMGYASAILLKSDNSRAGLVLEEFREPFYNTGFPGLVLACYTIIKN